MGRVPKQSGVGIAKGGAAIASATKQNLSEATWNPYNQSRNLKPLIKPTPNKK